jgi:hypothetical protein
VTNPAGAPTHRHWNRRDEYTGDDGTIYVCTEEGEPGTWVLGGGGASGQMTSTDVLFTEQAGGTALSFAISAVNQSTNTFTVVGDASALPGDGAFQIRVAGSTGNDGVYTVGNVGPLTFSGGHTDIPVSTSIPDGTGNGDVTVTIATYTATLAVAAGTRVVWWDVLPLVAPWASAWVGLTIEDSAATYISDGPGTHELHNMITGMSSAWAPLSPSGGANYFSLGMQSASDPTGPPVLYGNNAFPFTAGTGDADHAPGVYYEADDTITFKVRAATPSPPITPAGKVLVALWYFTPATPLVPDVT